VLTAFEATDSDRERLERHLEQVGFHWQDETDNSGFNLFLQSSQ